MKLDPNKIKQRVKRKAKNIQCRYKVIAIGLDKEGKFIGIKTNIPRRLSNIKRNSFHAEERLIFSSPTWILDTILIARLGNKGEFLPIDPCEKCLKLAKKYGVKIRRLV